MNTNSYIAESEAWFQEEYVNPLMEAVSLCESPIETTVLWALIRYHDSVRALGWAPPWGMPGLDEMGAVMAIQLQQGADAFTIYPQVTVKSATTAISYRLDFVLEYRHIRPEGHATVYVDIECDGHDYHERTKEQAERDKTRDRELQMLGYAVARFTGSQINRNPDQVARAIVRMAEQLAELSFRKLA